MKTPTRSYSFDNGQLITTTARAASVVCDVWCGTVGVRMIRSGQRYFVTVMSNDGDGNYSYWHMNEASNRGDARTMFNQLRSSHAPDGVVAYPEVAA